MNGKELRTAKFFNKSDNPVIVAIDHDMFNDPIPFRQDFKQRCAMW